MKLTQTLLTIALFTGLMTLSVTGLSAAGSELAQADNTTTETKTETVCTTGAYGQETCTKTTTKETKEIVLKDGTVLGEHEPVEAGIDPRLAAMAAGMLVSGVASVKFSLKK